MRLPFPKNGPKLSVLMRQLKRILGPLVISLTLYAVWPSTDYDSRLQLFNEVVEASEVLPANQPRTPPGCFGFLCSVRSSQSPSVSLDSNPKGQYLRAIFPVLQDVGPPAVLVRLNYDSSALSLYQPASVLRPAGRAPPRSN